jgi:hypothetical protein
MKKALFDKLISLPDEYSGWLAVGAETSIEHLRWYEHETTPSSDDQGLAELERAFLYCYGLCVANGLLLEVGADEEMH